jgi:hypothetical protein
MVGRGARESEEADRTVAADPASNVPLLAVLCVGHCEPMKAAVHGLLLATAGLCLLYNGAAWLKRRDRHLAVNTILYSLVVGWERIHVRHHLARRSPNPVGHETRLPDAA